VQENHFDVAGQLINLCAQQILFSKEKESEKRDLYSGTLETGVNCGKMNNERQTIVIF
jgi:hypothetical protein